MDNRREVLAAIREAHRHPLDGGPWRPFPLEPTPEREEHALQLGRALVGAVEEARRADEAARDRDNALRDAAREKQKADEAASEASLLKARSERARAGRAKGAEEARKMKPRRDLESEIVKRVEMGYTNRRIAKYLKCRPSLVADVRKKRFP